MKKLQVFIVAALLLVSAGISAQTKIGYIRINDIVGLMPELAPEKVTPDALELLMVTELKFAVGDAARLRKVPAPESWDRACANHHRGVWRCVHGSSYQ